MSLTVPMPVVAIVGRPNVGKSTLFNQLTRTRDALVVDLPGVTRDRHYGKGVLGDKPFLVIDTGGIGHVDTEIEALMGEQSWQAVEEADIVFFLVDARSGRTGADTDVAMRLRQFPSKKIQVVVNKTDGLEPEGALSDFYGLGLGTPKAISASHNRGIHQLIDEALLSYPYPASEEVETDFDPESDQDPEERLQAKIKADRTIKITIAGRPNVGKSTLVNRILGEERSIVFDEPGTTRDSLYIPFERHGKHYTIIDTAGVRKKAKIHETVEKFSVIKSLQAIEECQVVILVIDAKAGILEQDLSLIGFVLEAGKALVVAVNKWDGLEYGEREEIKKVLNYRLNFAEFAKVHYISALHGSGVGNLFDSILSAYDAATRPLVTGQLTRILELAVERHPPPMFHGRRIKLRYAHTGGHNPPLIIIHGNLTEGVTEGYKRYLINFFRDHLKLQGTPIRMNFKSGVNPFADRKNILTPRQILKRKRMMDHHKKK